MFGREGYPIFCSFFFLFIFQKAFKAKVVQRAGGRGGGPDRAVFNSSFLINSLGSSSQTLRLDSLFSLIFPKQSKGFTMRKSAGKRVGPVFSTLPKAVLQ